MHTLLRFLFMQSRRVRNFLTLDLRTALWCTKRPSWLFCDSIVTPGTLVFFETSIMMIRLTSSFLLSASSARFKASASRLSCNSAESILSTLSCFFSKEFSGSLLPSVSFTRLDKHKVGRDFIFNLLLNGRPRSSFLRSLSYAPSSKWLL